MPEPSVNKDDCRPLKIEIHACWSEAQSPPTTFPLSQYHLQSALPQTDSQLGLSADPRVVGRPCSLRTRGVPYGEKRLEGVA